MTNCDNELRRETRDEIVLNHINIYRYKFTEDFMGELFKFSKIHQYDDRNTFKEAWNDWIEENKDIIDAEIMRLQKLNYVGDVLDKMYKSARYYFRNKNTDKKEPTKRRSYINVQKDLIDAMDEHIRENIASDDFKPSTGFDTFCQENIDLLREEVTALCKTGLNNSNDIKLKIKKTYKNRYFIISTK